MATTRASVRTVGRVSTCEARDAKRRWKKLKYLPSATEYSTARWSHSLAQGNLI